MPERERSATPDTTLLETDVERENPVPRDMEQHQESESNHSEKRVEREKDTGEITRDEASPLRKRQQPPRIRKGNTKGQNQPQNTRKELEGTQEKETGEIMNTDAEGGMEQLTKIKVFTQAQQGTRRTLIPKF